MKRVGPDNNGCQGPGAPEFLREAPGRPGVPPRWASGSKMAGGTSRSDASLVWFTIGRGVLEEVYYPRIDSPCTRELYCLVTGPGGFFSDEREDAEHRVDWLSEGIPGFVVTNTCARGKYRIEKTILTDDKLNAVLQETRFTVLEGHARDYRLFVYLNPHVAGKGSGNTAWVGDFKGRMTLCAERGDLALALLVSTGFSAASAGFVGKSDGTDELKAGGRLTRTFVRAHDGNVSLVAEVDLSRGGEFTLSLGLGFGPGEAAHHALAGLQRGFADARRAYVAQWQEWQSTLLPLDDQTVDGRDLYRVSTANLLVHSNKSLPGAVASLAIPWGDHRGDEDLLQGAYHLVWSRDLVQHGGGLLAVGAHGDARRLLEYLQATQEPDGHWPQNMWVSGEPFWDGVQLDQAAQPALLADLALREGALRPGDRERFWPMVRRAVGYLVREGAATEQDRWEEQPGYNAYTLAAMIAALLAASEWADAGGESQLASGLRETAALWDAHIEGWLYVRNTRLARKLNIDGYYARILPREVIEPATPGQAYARLRDGDGGDQDLHPAEVVSVDALALVRFGLRAPDDPRILNTLRAIDAELKLDTPRGPIWHRYSADRFGEHNDGTPFDIHNKGCGRAWPLLIGERAHYEFARGDRERAQALMTAMANYASETGMISEQVWDAPDVPERGLVFGRPTGSVMPLLWAHSEYLKLRRTLHDGRIFDRPPQAAGFLAAGPRRDIPALWRIEHPCRAIPAGTRLRVETVGGVELCLKIAGRDLETPPAARDLLGVRILEIPAKSLPAGTEIRLTVSVPGDDGRRHEAEHSISVESCRGGRVAPCLGEGDHTSGAT